MVYSVVVVVAAAAAIGESKRSIVVGIVVTVVVVGDALIRVMVPVLSSSQVLVRQVSDDFLETGKTRKES